MKGCLLHQEVPDTGSVNHGLILAMILQGGGQYGRGFYIQAADLIHIGI